MNADWTAFISGDFRKGNDNFVIESSTSGDNVYNIVVEDKERSQVFERFILTDDENYVVFSQEGFKSFDDGDQTEAFNLHPLSNGQVGDRIQLRSMKVKKASKPGLASYIMKMI